MLQTKDSCPAGWGSAEDHIAFKSSSSYSDFTAALQPSLAANAAVESTLVRFKEDPLVALKAPFTEFLWLGLKEGVKAEELEEGIQNVEAIFPGAVAEGISVGGVGDRKGVV